MDTNAQFNAVMKTFATWQTQGYRMVPFNLKLLAKFGFSSNCWQTLHWCLLARARKINALHIFAENAPVDQHYNKHLQCVRAPLHRLKVTDQCPPKVKD